MRFLPVVSNFINGGKGVFEILLFQKNIREKNVMKEKKRNISNKNCEIKKSLFLFQNSEETSIIKVRSYELYIL